MASPPASGPPRRRVVRKKLVGKRDVVEVTLSATRDWSELPLDALASIFGKLDAIEILMGAGLVCRSWLAAAKLPDLWRSVDMAGHNLVDDDQARSCSAEPKINGDVLCAMARVAVDRSGGQMEEFVGRRFVTDELLNYIGDRSPALKTLGLMSCYGVSNQGFTYMIAKCPMLEDLRLVSCHNVGGRDVYEATGMACARLKHFTLREEFYISRAPPYCPRGEMLGVAAMHELRSLCVNNYRVTEDELAAILEGCPHLELLDLRGCCLYIVSSVCKDTLRAMCAGIKSVKLPCDYAIEQKDVDGVVVRTIVDIGSDSDSDWDWVAD